RLAARLRRRPEYQAARRIAFYLAADGEVETREMIRQALADGKRVAAPIPMTTTRTIRFAELTGVRRGLVRGPYGIAQPARRARRVAPSALDLIVVPGLAFDAQGHRLGRGAGYYDRFLATLPTAIPRIGLAFRCQRVRRLPRARHDQPVTTVLAA
ncbi:MAG: 5-formyltetrahydrofolate cyclo-ligase, partial [Omnitrophica WOR_2 bacterium RIFCSPHIGHO2_02_FULL_68_15]